jgi:hypothetical protein
VAVSLPSGSGRASEKFFGSWSGNVIGGESKKYFVTGLRSGLYIVRIYMYFALFLNKNIQIHILGIPR